MRESQSDIKRDTEREPDGAEGTSLLLFVPPALYVRTVVHPTMDARADVCLRVQESRTLAQTPDEVAAVVMERVVNVEHPTLRVNTNPAIQVRSSS